MRQLLIFVGALVVAALLLVCFLLGTGSAQELPLLKGRVTDQAGLLPDSQRLALDARLARIENTYKDHPQVVVLLPASLGGASIDDFKGDVFRKWKLGQRGLDNGLLYVLAPKERKQGIEVGYGLEGKMPDYSIRAYLKRAASKLGKGHEDWAGAISSVLGDVEAALKQE